MWNSAEGFGANLTRILRMGTRPTVMRAALPLATELFMGIRKKAPAISRIHPSLREQATRLSRMVQEHSHQFKQASKRYKEEIITRQAVQARVADVAMWLHAWACTLSKLDHDVRQGADGPEFERDRTAAMHFFELAEHAIHVCFRELYENSDATMLTGAAAAMKYTETLPNSEYSIPEKTPVAQGTGRTRKQDGIKQFPGDKHLSDTLPAGSHV
jgi:hypothetical protein